MAETQNWIDIPKWIDTPIELEKIWVKIVEWWEFKFNDIKNNVIKYDWIKISFHGQPLNIPLFSKNWENISNRISSFLTKMTHESCREQLFWLSKTCRADVAYRGSENSIGIDDKIIVTAKDFSDFVGISIIRWDRDYEWMRDLLDKLGIYPRKKTMIDDFGKQWDNTPTEPLYVASWKQDTLAKLAQNWRKMLNEFSWKSQQNPSAVDIAVNPSTGALRKQTRNP